MNIAEWLFATARTSPTAPALLKGETVVADYKEFALRSQAIAAGLTQTYGIAPGDRVGVWMKNRTEYLEVLYGIWWAGAVAVPINAKLHTREAVWILQNAEAELVFVSEDVGASLADPAMGLGRSIRILSADSAGYKALFSRGSLVSPQRRRPEDLAWLFYTSGTTGKPKGVMLSNENLVAMSLCYPIDVDPVSSGDAALYAAPLSHGAGMYNFIHVRNGARHVIPNSGGFDSDEILDLAVRLDNVSMFAAPTMVRRLVDAVKSRPEPGKGIKTIVYGGGPMYLNDILDAVDAMGPRFIQIYGQGESPMTITALSRQVISDTGHPRASHRLASVGTAQSCVEVRVAGDDLEPLPVGEAGEVIVRGTTVMLGYWRNEQATRDTLHDGWLRTGDIGLMDEDGFLTLCDRSKDVIISGGTNIYSREVEEALLTHPGVYEVAVIGRPHKEWGEEIVAFVVRQQGEEVDEAVLDTHCLEQIARFKRPRAYYWEKELPKNNYGKILKTVLREKLVEVTRE